MTWLRNRALMWMIVLILGAGLVSDRTTEGVGDRLQVALPLAGLGCAIASGQGLRYTGRFFLATFTMHGSKRLLGHSEINARPNGGYHGMPSGHTTAAAFGAAGLAQTCLANNPPAQVAAIMAAGYVGGSRIDVGAHTVWQVIAGALLGWIAQVAALSAFDAGFRRFCSAIGRGFAWVFRAIRGY